MLCPVCEDAMVIVEFGQVELDLCLTCSGLWFDAEELDLLGEQEAAAVERELAEFPVRCASDRKCPRCHRRLQKIDAPGTSGTVEIDRCGYGDGLWLDRGELPELLAGSLGDGHPALARVRDFLGRFAAPQEREET